MATHSGRDTDTETRRDRRRRYERILGIVESNTGHGQPALMRIPTVCVIASHADIAPDDVQRTIRAACEHQDLLRTDHLGRPRVCRTDPDSLRAAAAFEAEREGATNAEFVAHINRLIKEVRDDG